MIWLAVDPGKRRLGVALSDELGWAHPLVTLERRGNRRDIEAIGRLAKEHGVEGIVAAEIEKALALPVRLQDERLSSFEAEGRLKSAGVKIGRKRGLVDQLAAVVILEDFLAGWEKK